MSLFALFFLALAHAQPLCSTNYSISPRDWINDIDEINRCNPLTKPGDARVFNVTRASRVRAAHQQENVSSGNIETTNYKLPTDHKGSLKYLGDKQYEMVFNLNLTATDDATVTPAAMLNRVRSCLDAARPGLRGPSGEQLNLIAVTPTQANQMGDMKPPVIDIKIIKPGERGSAQEYSSDFSCATIVHELLHFAGLCDEYKDNGQDVNASACRAMGPGDSMMGEGMHIAFDDSVGEFGRCEIPSNSSYSPYLQSTNPVVREMLMRKKYFQIANVPSASVGLPPQYPVAVPATISLDTELAGASVQTVAVTPPQPLTLKKIYCVEKDSEFVPFPTSVDETFNSLLLNTSDKIEIRSYILPVLNSDGTVTTVSRQTLSCSCPPGDLACRHFLDIIRPDVVAISSPQRKVYACPDIALKKTPVDFAVPQGQLNIAAQVVNYRNRSMGRPMLHPAHFARVINGPCHIENTPDIVKRYNDCARFSVNYSVEDLGDSPCTQRPSHCDRPEAWLGALPTSTNP